MKTSLHEGNQSFFDNQYLDFVVVRSSFKEYVTLIIWSHTDHHKDELLRLEEVAENGCQLSAD